MTFRMYNIVYFFRLAFQGIVRNAFMSFAAVMVLISSLLVSGSFWMLWKNVEYNLNELNEYNKIVVFVSKDKSRASERLREKIAKIDGVKEAVLLTKDEVLDNLFEEYGDYGDILDMYHEDNPLKDQIIITYDDSSRVDAIVYLINNMNEEEETMGAVAKINDRRDVARKIDQVKNYASIIFTWLMVLLFVVSVFIIINTIKLTVASRRDEISIMRYIGASGIFVSAPFVLQGVILGLFSAGVAYGLQYAIYRNFAQEVLGNSGLITILPFRSLYAMLLILFLGVGVGLGIAASLISLRRYNKA